MSTTLMDTYVNWVHNGDPVTFDGGVAHLQLDTSHNRGMAGARSAP